MAMTLTNRSSSQTTTSYDNATESTTTRPSRLAAKALKP